eukprot:TRINITY_DN49197_c0_g1_i1.p1 TRINITY_DN49197_c0_g1~~TRINITY_DN49197_c0_g1_i1.p1  ORF type:complete len:342 (-),score=58.80 TRINITY_DN49197_c0_g1_i1:504-1529(-)
MASPCLSAPKLPIQNRSNIVSPTGGGRKGNGPKSSPTGGKQRRDKRQQTRWADYTPTTWHDMPSPWPEGAHFGVGGAFGPQPGLMQYPGYPDGVDDPHRGSQALWPATPTPNAGPGSGYGFGSMDHRMSDAMSHMMPGSDGASSLSLQPPPRVAAMAAAAEEAARKAAAAVHGSSLQNQEVSGARVKNTFIHVDDDEDHFDLPKSKTMPNVYKKQLSLEQQTALAHLGMDEDEEDDGPQDPAAVGDPAALGLPSKGSVTHGTGKCRPCAWFWKPQGCQNDLDCGYCHLCPEGELKIRKKSKVQAMRMGALAPAAKSGSQSRQRVQQGGNPARVLKLSPLLN